MASEFKSFRERVSAARELQKQAQKAETELASKIDAQMRSGGTPLTGKDNKLRAEHGENVATTGAKNDEGLKLDLADIAPSQVMEDATRRLGAKVTTNKTCTADKKAAWLAAADKTASLVVMDKHAALAEDEESIMVGISKQAALTPNPSGVLYKEASRVAAALFAAKALPVLEMIEKRSAATLAGHDTLHLELTKEAAADILELNDMLPDGEMTPEEHAAILKGAPADELADAAAVVTGNTGDDAELPEATDEELAKLEDTEAAVEGAEEKTEGKKKCKCGDEKCEGCDDGKEAEAALNHGYLCQYISSVRGEKIASYRPRPTAEAVALKKIALLQRTVEGLRSVIEGQDDELSKMASLQDKVASLESSANKIATVSPDKVNAMFAEATRAGLVSGTENEIQNMKLAAMGSPDKLAEAACQIIRSAASKQINKLGSVRAVRVEDERKVEDTKEALARLRKTIGTK
jgi:hypothetical protein